MDILSCPLGARERGREKTIWGPPFLFRDIYRYIYIGGGVTGYLRGQRGIKQSMAGSKGACSSYEILVGSFFLVSPIVSRPIKEDPIVGKSRIVFLFPLSLPFRV